MSWLFVILNFILILFIIYLLLCAGYFILHRFFILFPSRKLTLKPSDFQLKYEDVFFKTRDNVKIHGWFIEGSTGEERKDTVFVLFPGNKGTISGFLEPMSYLAKSGYNVFLFSYRGFGRSQKKWPTENGVFRDSEAACEYLLRERDIPGKNIVFLGQSLGCAMAAHTSTLFDPAALIMEGAFPSVKEVAARAVKWLPLKWLTTSRFDTKHYLGKVSCPVLILHSREDRAIPLSDSNDLFNAVPGRKSRVLISGPHAKGLVYDHEKYIYAVNQFLRII